MADNIMDKLVVIASSTGGPNALHLIIPMLAKGLDAPVVVVQHMPKGFTATLAERLDETSKVTVKEAVHGDVLKKGHVYIARGGKHLQFSVDRQQRLIFHENEDDPILGLRPCADITFESLCSIPIGYTVCVVLTGMGSDGYKGIKKLREKQNVYTIAQDRETSVVYGMPKAIVDHGIADAVLPLEKIPTEIMKKVGVH